MVSVTTSVDVEASLLTVYERVAWKSTDGTIHAGVIIFHRLDDTTTRVAAQTGRPGRKGRRRADLRRPASQLRPRPVQAVRRIPWYGDRSVARGTCRPDREGSRTDFAAAALTGPSSRTL